MCQIDIPRSYVWKLACIRDVGASQIGIFMCHLSNWYLFGSSLKLVFLFVICVSRIYFKEICLIYKYEFWQVRVSLAHLKLACACVIYISHTSQTCMSYSYVFFKNWCVYVSFARLKLVCICVICMSHSYVFLIIGVHTCHLYVSNWCVCVLFVCLVCLKLEFFIHVYEYWHVYVSVVHLKLVCLIHMFENWCVHVSLVRLKLVCICFICMSRRSQVGMSHSYVWILVCIRINGTSQIGMSHSYIVLRIGMYYTCHLYVSNWYEYVSFECLVYLKERWGAGVETQKNVRGEVGGWGRVPFNEPYAPSSSTIYDGA